MPHKRNPVLTENLTGLARLVRWQPPRPWRTWRSGTSATSRTLPSSADRPGRHRARSTFALARLTGVIDKLVVYPERMQKQHGQASPGGLVHSQRVPAGADPGGVSREDAYRLVQRNAMKVWDVIMPPTEISASPSSGL
jgi:adenylosuccinate lyase